jgi:DNA (cytosine-5)-methyltransferase 1
VQGAQARHNAAGTNKRVTLGLMGHTNSRKVVFADAFAGCGGLSLGLMQAGLVGSFAIEHDKFAFETLRTNLLKRGARHRFKWPRWLPREPISIDVLLDEYQPHVSRLSGKIDLLVGGPPCQGFSTAGKRIYNDPRNRLFHSYLEIVSRLKPRAVLIENVRGITMDFERKGGVENYASKLRASLSRTYDVYERLLDLSAFGVPQFRKRYFLLALQPGTTHEDPFDTLLGRLPSFLRALGLRVPVSSWAAISDLEVFRGGTRESTESPGFREIRCVRPLTQYQKLLAKGTKAPADLRLARHADDIAGRFKEIIEASHAEGRLNTSISETLRARFGLRKRALRVLDPDRPSPTVTSMPDDLLHYSEPRTLTVRENARLQGFPDWFSFKGKYTTGGSLRRHEVPRFTQVANAVPPLVGRAIGEMLLAILRRPSERPVNPGTRASRTQRRVQPAELSA